MQLKSLSLSIRPPVVLAILAALAVSASEVPGQTAQKATYLADRSFQLPGDRQPGAPDRPSAIGIAPDGQVHVADERGAVHVYDVTGHYQGSYGQGQLDRASGLVIAQDGTSYVLDGGRKQVAVFTSSGELVRRFSSRGNRGGQLGDPIDIVLGPNRFVYVLDAARDGVVIFSHAGVYVRDVIPGDPISDPSALAVARDGSIYIADKSSPNRIFRYEPFTELLWKGRLPRAAVSVVGVRGANLDEPVSMVTNDLGTVLILDKEMGRVWRVNPHAAAVGANDLLYGGAGTGRGSFKEAVDIAFAGSDEVVILDKELRKVERVKLTTESGLPTRPKFHFPFRISPGPRALPQPLLATGTARDGAVRLALTPDRGTVHLVGTQVEYHDTPLGRIPAFLPNPAALAQRFSSQIGEAAAAAMNDTMIVIADSRRNRFALFNIESGQAYGSFGDNYRDNRRLRDPSGVDMFPDGRILIADTGNDALKLFAADLASLVAMYRAPSPRGVTIGPAGDIVAWSEDGDWIGVLPAGGDELERLPSALVPGSVASAVFDRAGNLLILDGDSHRITVLAAGLKKVLIQMGNEGALRDPSRLVLDHQGNIYLVDDGEQRTSVLYWTVASPGLANLSVDYREDAARLSWQASEPEYAHGYLIQAAAAAGGPYQLIGRTVESYYEIKVDELGANIPHYVRVVPVYVTGASGEPTRPLPLFNFTVAAAYRRGDYENAQEEARKAIELMESGVLEASQESQSEILYYAFVSAYAQRDYDAAVSWARKLGPVVTRTHAIDFLYKLAELHLRAGDAKLASQRILTLVGQGPRPEYFTNPAVVDQSFRIYRALRNSGYAADGLEFLRLYAQAMPATIPEHQAQYRDSITVFSTRTKLGPGFDYWRSASFGEAVAFFENTLLTAGLSVEQEVLSRQILSAAYYAFGRRGEAEDTFREIFTVRPSFDLEREIPRVRTLYNLTIYNPETRSFFGSLRRRS